MKRAIRVLRRRPWRSTSALLAAMIAAAMPALPLSAQNGGLRDPVVDVVEREVTRLRAGGALRIGDEVIPRLPLTLAVYEERGFLPLWTNPEATRSLLHAIADVWEDGLDPRDYHFPALVEARTLGRGAAGVAELDLLRTDAFVRMAIDLRFGKTDPKEYASSRAAPWRFGGPDAVAEMVVVVAAGRVREALADLRPQHYAYRGLREALVELRELRAAGGWGTIPPGPALEGGSVDERTPLLRRRLALTGDGGVAADAMDLRVDSVDSTLEAAIRSFQHRHGLNEDGVVGPATLAALNVSVERRIEQVRINLERARWLSRDLPGTFVVVNVAGAKVDFVQDGRVELETRAVVGTASNETPSFTAPMLWVELNPAWTVPSGIVGEVLGRVARDPGYLAAQAMRVLDGSGREVAASQIDFSRYSAADFPWVFRQDPGPLNPLGRIKLMFPNKYHVYLHDTPARGDFAREERLFSHGCIRVDDPTGLAELVLGNPLVWNRETLQAAIATGKTVTIRLPHPVQVFVLYRTAWVDSEGTLHFYRDVYDRDDAILAQLDATPGGGTLGGRDR